MTALFTEYKLLSSMIYIAVILLLRWFVNRKIKLKKMDDLDLQRKWSNSVNNASTLLIVLGLFILWMSELKYFALSIAAFVVALVVATREFLQCFIGYLYMASTRTFTIGDWIKIHEFSGEVVRKDWLSTTLIEIDFENMNYHYTGKSLVIPNNQFIISTIQNLNFMRHYIAHSFMIVREPDKVNAAAAKQFLLEKAQLRCKGFKEVGLRYSNLLENKIGVSISSEVSVRVTTSNIGKEVYVVNIYCPTQQAMEIEQELTEAFMEYWYQQLNSMPPKSA